MNFIFSFVFLNKEQEEHDGERETVGWEGTFLGLVTGSWVLEFGQI